MEALDSKVRVRDPSPRPARHQQEVAAGRRLCCGRCGAPITTDDDRIDVSDAHEHVFVNPAGHVYRVGCFQSAPGSRPLGEPTPFFSWFPGYPWRVALCSQCHEHLGWAYGAPTDFFGLILDRLADCHEP